VVMPLRDRHYGRLECVFVDGHIRAQHKTFAEAMRHARDLADGLRGDPSDWAVET
jgi:prepilin-type processing-associated H-X9-DG protein